MSPPQKLEYMMLTAMPRMKSLFMKFDPHRYPKMSCVPCHSSDARVGWRMPNPDLLLDADCAGGALPGLAGAAPTSDHAHHEEMSKMDRFMLDEVGPEMAALLGKPAYDPRTNTGFGCFGCHTPER